MENTAINVNTKIFLTIAGMLLVISLAFFAGKSTSANKSEAGGQEEINNSSIHNQPTAPSGGGGGCGV